MTENKDKPEDKSNKELNARQRIFVGAYVDNGGNATQAAIAAGYSERTANTMGSRLTNPEYYPHVVKEIEKQRDDLQMRLLATPDRVVEELARIAFFNMKDVMKSDGSLIPFQRS